MQSKICECGKCGRIPKKGNKFIHGHNASIKSGTTWEQIHGDEKTKRLKSMISKQFKGKTYEQIMGEEKAKKLKKKRGENARKHKLGKTYEEIYKDKKILRKMKNRSSLKNLGEHQRRMEEEIEMEKLLKPLGFESEVFFGTGHKGREKYKTTKFTADFYLRKNKLIVELDGSSHSMKGVKERDERKNKFFKDKGYKMLRFDIAKEFNPQKILKEINNFRRNS